MQIRPGRGLAGTEGQAYSTKTGAKSFHDLNCCASLRELLILARPWSS